VECNSAPQNPNFRFGHVTHGQSVGIKALSIHNVVKTTEISNADYSNFSNIFFITGDIGTDTQNKYPANEAILPATAVCSAAS
jgi:hypothetical protein